MGRREKTKTVKNETGTSNILGHDDILGQDDMGHPQASIGFCHIFSQPAKISRPTPPSMRRGLAIVCRFRHRSGGFVILKYSRDLAE
jgi:hypothetical protein